MSPKKQMTSPFGLFMNKMKMIDNNLHKLQFNKVVKHCDHIYVNMSDKQKKPFLTLSQTIREKALNEYQINECLRRLTLNSEDNQSEDDWDQLCVNTCHQSIESNESIDTLDDYSRVKSAIESQKDIKSMSIIIISFNILMKTMDGKCYPNEIALTKCTLNDGIHDSYHNFIYNTIPDGYYATAKEFASETHKIPINPLASDHKFVKDYGLLFKDIFEFMDCSHLIDKQNKKLVFCKAMDNKSGIKDKPQIVGCLQWLSTEANKESQTSADFSGFEIIDLSELLFVLTNGFTGRPRSLMTDDLSKCIYDYIKHTNCEFHDEIENRFCALGVSKRLCYMLFDCCLELMDIKRKPNHNPIEQDEDKPQVSIIRFRDTRRITNAFKANEQTVDSDLNKGWNGNKGQRLGGIGRGNANH